MPNNKGGKKYKKAKKTTLNVPVFEIAQEEQEYARIVRKLGDKRYDMILQSNSKKCIGRARGALRGCQNIIADVIVLVSARDFRNNEEERFVEQTYDILNYYTKEQVRKLIKLGKLTNYSFDDKKSEYHPDNSNIEFVRENDDDDDDDDSNKKKSNDEDNTMIQIRKYDISSDSSDSSDDDIDDI